MARAPRTRLPDVFAQLAQANSLMAQRTLAAEERERQERMNKGGMVGAVAGGLTALASGGSLPVIAAATNVGGQVGRAARGGQLDPVALSMAGLQVADILDRESARMAERDVLDELAPSAAATLQPGDVPATGALPGLGAPLPADARPDPLAKLMEAAGESSTPFRTAAQGLQIAESLRPPAPKMSTGKPGDFILEDGRPVGRLPGGGKDQKPPATREVKRGDKIVTEQWNGPEEGWAEIGTADRWQGNQSDDTRYNVVDAKGITRASGLKFDAAKKNVDKLGEGAQLVQVGTRPFFPDDESAKPPPAHKTVDLSKSFRRAVTNLKDISGAEEMVRLVSQGFAPMEALQQAGSLDRDKIELEYMAELQREINNVTKPASERAVAEAELDRIQERRTLREQAKEALERAGDNSAARERIINAAKQQGLTDEELGVGGAGLTLTR